MGLCTDVNGSSNMGYWGISTKQTICGKLSGDGLEMTQIAKAPVIRMLIFIFIHKYNHFFYGSGSSVLLLLAHINITIPVSAI